MMLPFSQINRSNSSRQHRFMLNEKSLVLLLILISIITIFIILFNLPNDISQRVAVINKNVFMPDLKPPPPQAGHIHNEYHQHPPPPMPNDARRIENNINNNNKPFKSNEEQAANHPSDNNENDVVAFRREKIRSMTLFAWQNYEKYAWGENELRPISKVGHSANIFGSKQTKLGATIVDGLDTMYLMGYKDEYERGRQWIIDNLNLNIDADVSAFEINIRFIGGLLSLHSLTNDKIFLAKAEEIAILLMPIFDSPTGIPFALVNPKTKTVKNYNWASGSCSILAEFGTLSLEFQYLSDLTGNKLYESKVNKIQHVLDGVKKENGLYYNYLSPQTASWCMKHASMGALGDSFYEYLLKLWVYNSHKEKTGTANNSDLKAKNKQTLDMFLAAIRAIKDQLVQTSPGDQLTYVGEYKSANRIDRKMDHLACFSGGLFSMSAKFIVDNSIVSDEERQTFMEIGKNITHTCHESYIRTATHLGPEAFHFERADQEAMALKPNERYYILRPEVVESYFYMWRFTKDPKYREWAWDMAIALEKHSRTPNGYSGIKDVYEASATKDDVQQSFFFAETLKYLYLIFCDDDVLPLDKYVLNTEAHPLLMQ